MILLVFSAHVPEECKTLAPPSTDHEATMKRFRRLGALRWLRASIAAHQQYHRSLVSIVLARRGHTRGTGMALQQ